MHIEELSKSMDYAFTNTVRTMRSRFDLLDSRLRPERAIEDIKDRREDVEDIMSAISSDLSLKMERYTMRLDAIGERPENRIQSILQDSEDTLESDSKQLEGLNPLNVLTRGYSMITGPDGTVITSVGGLNVGNNVTIRMRDGTASADITKKEMNQ
jgi:exodeoxyribonuclease VII large subunit